MAFVTFLWPLLMLQVYAQIRLAFSGSKLFDTLFLKDFFDISIFNRKYAEYKKHAELPSM